MLRKRSFKGNPEYHWRIRKKAEEKQEKSNREWWQSENQKQVERILTSIGAVYSQRDRHKADDDRHWRCERFFQAGEIFALVAAAVVGVVAIVVGSNDVTKAIKASNRIATAARDQADVAKATARPYIFIEFTGFNMEYLLPWNRGESKLRMPFHVKNYGTTPAIIDGVRCSEIDRTDIPDFNIINPPRGEPFYYLESHQVLAAGATSSDYRCFNQELIGSFEQITNPNRDPADVEKWREQREREIDRGELWFIAEARYRDFRNNPYSTTICVQLQQINWPPKEGGGAGCNERK